MKLIGILTLLSAISLTLCDSDTIDLIREFCEYNPSQVKVYLCWEKDSRKFAHGLYKINALISVETTGQFNKSQCSSKYSGAMTFVVNIDCPEGMNVLEMANEEKLFRPPNRWLLLTKSKLADMEASRKFGHLDLFLNTAVIVAQRNSENRGNAFVITELYKTGLKEPLILNTFGYWCSNHSLSHSNHLSPLKRKNLNGLIIPAVIVVTLKESLNMLDDLRDKHVDTVSKYNYVFINQVMDFMNSSAKYVVEDTWGYKVNGTYNGMVGKIERGEAEIAATALFFTAERLSILEYVSMTTPTRFRFIFRQPKLSSVRNIFLLPFTASVWASYYAILFITSFLLFYTVKYENKFAKVGIKSKRKGKECNRNYLRVSWNDAIFLTFGASCQQGFFADPQGVAGRLVTIALYIAVILVHTSYSANIVALIQSSGSVIQTISDLLNSPMKVGVHDIVYNRHFFEQISQDPVKNQLYQTKIAPIGKKPAFYEMNEGIGRVRKGLFAFHVELGSGYKLIKETFATEEKCHLHEIPFLQASGAWIAIKKHSPYSELLKVAFRRIQECGMQNREYLRWFTKKPVCAGGQSSFVQVGLADIWVALLALGFGIAVAIGILILEVFINSRSKKWNNAERCLEQ